MKKISIDSNKSPNIISSWNIENDKLCNEIIKFFEDHKSMQRVGITALGYDPKHKKTTDMTITPSNLKDQKLLGVILSCVSPENYELNINEIKNIGVPFGFKLNGYLQTKPLPKPSLKNKDNKFVQPNKFLGKRKDLTPEKMLEFVKKFKNNGATILGGCCETSPSHIKAFTSLK